MANVRIASKKNVPRSRKARERFICPIYSKNGVLNLKNKELTYYVDKNNSKRVEYINNLPNDYTPKIRIIIKETEKNSKPRKIFTKKYVKKLYKRFDCKTKKNRNGSKTNAENDNTDGHSMLT